jgi:hypothetical protein
MRTTLIAYQALAIAEYAAQALVAAEQLRLKTKPVAESPLLKQRHYHIMPPRCYNGGSGFGVCK